MSGLPQCNDLFDKWSVCFLGLYQAGARVLLSNSWCIFTHKITFVISMIVRDEYFSSRCSCLSLQRWSDHGFVRTFVLRKWFPQISMSTRNANERFMHANTLKTAIILVLKWFHFINKSTHTACLIALTGVLDECSVWV